MIKTKFLIVITIVIILVIITLSSLFYLNTLISEKYDIIEGVDKIVSMSIEDRKAEILMVQDFLKINVILSILLLIIAVYGWKRPKF